MNIVEVIAQDPYAAQAALGGIAEIASATQLGVRLRVLIPERHDNPVRIVETLLAQHGVAGKTSLSAASLEDVFVAVTMKSKERGQ